MGEIQKLIDEEMKDPEFAAAFRRAEQRLAERREWFRRGYEQAITHLRDTAGYDAWCDDPLRSLFRSRADDWFRDHFADYLSARLTEETTP